MQKETGYEIVVGLEVHVQLLTKSKLFCGDSTAFGAEPNTSVSPITLAHPGTLPRMNREAIGAAIKMGLACDCRIVTENYFARKHYFYPDLPKGYQVSQHSTPICSGGSVMIRLAEQEKIIRLNRIHLEEDAGKSLHDIDPVHTSIDLNRAGTALIEIVTEPDIRSGEEALAFLNSMRRLVRYLQISDGNLEEGSLRCDANISVRKKGQNQLGTKVEIKNLNSMRHVRKAIESEAARLTEQLIKGEKILQQTRGFDAGSSGTFPIRDKEEADDYRYFPEPDLTPFRLDEAFIEKIRQTMPALQEERINKYVIEFQLPAYDAQVLTEDREVSDYFEEVINSFSAEGRSKEKIKAASNWMLGPVLSYLNEKNLEVTEFSLRPGKLSSLIELVESGKLSFSTAASRIFPQMLEDPSLEPSEIAKDQDLFQQSESSLIEPIIDKVLSALPGKVAEFRKGKKGLLSLFVGEVMKQSKGSADPKVVNEILIRKLKKDS